MSAESLELPIDDGMVDVTVRRHARSRSIRISVDDSGEVRVTAPRHVSLREVHDAVTSRREWIQGLVHRAREWEASTAVDADAGGPARLLGSWYPVDVVHGGRRGGEFSGDRIALRVPAGQRSFDVLEWWYRQHARQVIEARVEEWSTSLTLQPARISIRDQRTRWGSCSSTGALSFNWRLVLAPLWVLDAIVVHELCHLVELNHSDRFWELVDTAYPRHGEAQEWLRQYGALLRVSEPEPPALQEPETADATPRPGDASLTLF